MLGVHHWKLRVSWNFKRDINHDWRYENPDFSEQIIFLVGLDLAVGLGVGDAGENESVTHLIIVEEGLIRLVDLSVDNLASAGAAGSSSAGVWKVETGLLGGIEHVGILVALNLLLTVWGNECHLVSSHHHVGASGGSWWVISEVIFLDWERAGTSD